RGLSVRFRRRPLRPQDRSRAPRLHPRGEEVRGCLGARAANARGRGGGTEAAGDRLNPPRACLGEGDRAKHGGGEMLRDIAPKARPGTTRDARKLRRKMTLPEVILWHWLRQRPNGLKFRRQHPTGPYVLDFFCSD